ncbi:T9SS type A sorting domain-containing protein [bacterium SCSIO 12741]|nr:T9SS type A sorting domain-containing protein [bacterium SCSIO 12741]
MRTVYCLLFILLFTYSHAQAQRSYILYDTTDFGADYSYSIAEWHYVENSIRQDRILTPRPAVITADFLVLNWKSGILVTKTDTGLVHIDVKTGKVSSRNWPYPPLGSLNTLCMKYDEAEDRIYTLYQNDKSEGWVAEYDIKTSTLINATRISEVNGVFVFPPFIYSAYTATFDTRNNSFLVYGDAGILNIDANSGIATAKPLPMEAQQINAHISFHYDEYDDIFYAVFLDSNGQNSFAKYDYVSNSFTEKHSLNQTAFGSQIFDAYSDVYDSQAKKLIVSNSKDLCLIDVHTGQVETRSSSVHGVPAKKFIILTAPSTTTSLVETTRPSIKSYPKPASDRLYLSGLNHEPWQATLFNLTGKKTMESQLNSDHPSLDVSSLENGLYILRIQQGTETITQKVVIRH